MIDKKYLAPTLIIDSDHPLVIAYAQNHTRKTGNDPVKKAISLYYAVRDDIWYDPYLPFYRDEHYQASNVLNKRRGFCTSKAALLCALGRASKIPSRIGFSTVQNHLATKQLLEYIGSNIFVYHGYMEFYLGDKWIKVTPAFNIELCEKHSIKPLEFNGCEDSIFHPYNEKQNKFMEYLKDHGTYSDIPVNEIVAAWKDAYGKDRVEGWIKAHEKTNSDSIRDYDKEDII